MTDARVAVGSTSYQPSTGDRNTLHSPRTRLTCSTPLSLNPIPLLQIVPRTEQLDVVG